MVRRRILAWGWAQSSLSVAATRVSSPETGVGTQLKTATQPQRPAVPEWAAGAAPNHLVTNDGTYTFTAQEYPNTHLTVVVNNALRNSLMPEGEWAAMRGASGR
jgi:hypothetical protein